LQFFALRAAKLPFSAVAVAKLKFCTASENRTILGEAGYFTGKERRPFCEKAGNAHLPQQRESIHF
jgi:hypothetical protein